jgi:hypothetical protein
MARATPIQNTFNAGEWNPELNGRSDLERYRASLRKCLNWIPRKLGGVFTRPGFEYICDAASDSFASKLVPFVYDRSQKYVIELGQNIFRVIQDGVLDTTLGSLGTPYTSAMAYELQIVQIGDVIRVCHQDVAPYKISRTGASAWTFAATAFSGGPLDTENADATRPTVTLSSVVAGATGVVVTASAALFDASMVGQLIQVREQDLANVTPWVTATAYVLNDLRRNDGVTYICTDAGTSGTTPPTHSYGAAYDGTASAAACRWEYNDPGYGLGVITAYVSPTVVNMTNITRFPSSLTATASYRVAFGAWGGGNGYPRAISMIQDRIAYGGTTLAPDTVWLSVTGDYDNFSAFDLRGKLVADQAITATSNSNQPLPITFLSVDERQLIVGTEGNEYMLAPTTTTEGISPENVDIRDQTAWGSKLIQPLRIGSSTIFAQSGGKGLRDMVFSEDVAGRYVANEISVLASHMFESGEIIDFAWQQKPLSCIWCVTSDGRLIGVTYDKAQQVVAFHEHTLGGYSDAGHTVAAKFESVCAVPSSAGTYDDVYVSTQRYANGAVRREILRLSQSWKLGNATADYIGLDSSYTYSGAPVTVVTGLSRFNGETVRVLADGWYAGAYVVSGGSITLPQAASKVTVGYPYTCDLQTQRWDVGAQAGASHAQVQTINNVGASLFKSAGFKYGCSFDNLDLLELRRAIDDMSTAVPVATGAQILLMPSSDSTGLDVTFCVRQDLPLPTCILWASPNVVTEEG